MNRKLLTMLLTFLVGGVTSAWGQTDVTSTYLTNADFEGSYTTYSNPSSDRAIYKPDGWTITYSNGESNDMTSLNSGCTQWNNFSSLHQPTNEVNNVYWIRFRWGTNESLTLSQTQSLPAGTYRLSADAYRAETSGTATISVAGQSVTVDSRNTWANYALVFTLTETTSVTIGLTFTQNGAQAQSRAGFDNVKLEQFNATATSDLSWGWTNMMANPGFERGTNGSGGGAVNVPYGFTMQTTMEGWKDGSINTTNPSEGNNLYNLWAGTVTSTDMYQTITLPIGKYTIAADFRTEEGKISDQGVYATVGGDTFKSGTISTIGDPWNGAAAWNNLTKTFYVPADNTSVRLGASSTGGESSVGWYQIDNFTLTYHGSVAKIANALAMNTNQSATANAWYAVTIPAAGDYKITSSAATTIYYTQTGHHSPGDATNTKAIAANGVETLSLSTGTLYFRSTAAATVKIYVDSYTYTVGTATSDKAYVQPGQTVTIAWPDAVSNNPSATFAKQGTPTITLGGNSLAVTPTANGFSFTVPSVAANGTYTLSIPDGAFGYAAGSTYNAAQDITFYTPAIYDRRAYLKENTSGLYLARGKAWGTRAYLGEYGTAVDITTYADGYTRLTFVDTQVSLGIENDNSTWCDKGANDYTLWTVTLNDGKYRLTSKRLAAGNYVKYDNGDTDKLLWANNTGGGGENIIGWTLVDGSTYASEMTAKINTQASDAATAAGTSAATPAALASAVSGWNSQKIFTGTTAATTPQSYQHGQDNGPITIMSGTAMISVPGLYHFSMQAFYRMRDNATNYPIHADGYDQPAAYVYFGSAKTQIKSVYDNHNASADGCYTGADGNYYPNNTASALTAFRANNYTNDVWVYIDQTAIDAVSGSFEYGIQYQGWPNWIVWDNGTARPQVAQWAIWSPETIDLTLYSDGYIPGMDLTSLITNPSFEADGTNVQVASGEALTGNTITGWTVTDPSSMGDAGVYANDGAYARLGVKGTYLYNTWWFGRPLYQSIGTPQAGIYELTALVATGDRGTIDGTGAYGTVNLYATCNGTTYTSTGYASNSMNLLQRERLVFEADGTHPVTIGIKGGEDATNAYTPGAVNTDGYWCYNCDDFTLTYLCKANTTDMAAALDRLATSNAPYAGVSDISTYETDYTTYAAYTSSNTKSELLTALNYIDNRYRDYRFANASPAHPYDLTDEVIWYASCATNGTPDDDTNAHRWYISTGRTFATGNHWSGDGSRQYMTQNVDGTTRAQTVKIPFRGYWRLRTTAKTTGDRSYVAITLTATDLSSAESVSERGNKGTTGGNVNIDGSEGTDNRANGNAGYGWYFLDLPFALSVHNAEKIISIGMGNGNHDYSWSAVGGMYLQYMGENYEETIDGIHYYYGYFPTAKTVEVTDAVPVADMTKATFGATATLTRTNPNGLAYTGAANPFATSTNVVVDGVCPSFVLADGHSLRIPYDFTASNASYTRSSVAPTGAGGVGAVGTLVLPFEITSAPDAVYRSADVSGITLRGRELTEVPGNTPVFITASGTYSGTGVPVRAVPDPAALQEDGELVGVYASTSAPNNSYVLQNHPSGGGVKFYIVDTSVATPTVTPFRAYVRAQSNNAPYLKFWFDEDETAIRRTEYTEEVEVTEIYDLQGRRLQRVTRPGLYIVNGKKVMMK